MSDVSDVFLLIRICFFFLPALYYCIIKKHRLNLARNIQIVPSNVQEGDRHLMSDPATAYDIFISYAHADAPGHDDEIPFSFSVDTKPLFLGDNPNAFSKWVTARLVYPEQSRLKGHEGTVIVHFVIFPDGTLHDIEVGKSSGDKLLDAEAIRVISLSPRWTPATLDQKPVKFYISAPVIFMLR